MRVRLARERDAAMGADRFDSLARALARRATRRELAGGVPAPSSASAIGDRP